MDSLGGLADNLPRNSSSALNAAEAELQSAFRNSALAITTLLRAAQKTSKKAFSAGYSAALQDVLEYLQQGLDTNQGGPSEGIAQVIDYIEARQEAVRLNASDIDGDDEPEASTSAHPARPPPPPPPQAARRTSQNLRTLDTSSHHVAGTTSQHSLQRNGSRQRHSTRSLSPTSASAASMRAPSSGRSHALSQQHHDSNDSASISGAAPQTSSTPNSSDYRSASLTSIVGPPSLDFSSSNPPSSTSAAGTSDSPAGIHSPSNLGTPASASLAAAQTPLTRLQARRGKERERERRHHPTGNHRRDRTRERGEREQDGDNSVTTAGMKRRWTASLLPGGGSAAVADILPPPANSLGAEPFSFGDEAPRLGLQNEHSVHLEGGQFDAYRTAADLPQDRDMDMDDGNSRPTKRVVRRQ